MGHDGGMRGDYRFEKGKPERLRREGESTSSERTKFDDDVAVAIRDHQYPVRHRKLFDRRASRKKPRALAADFVHSRSKHDVHCVGFLCDSAVGPRPSRRALKGL